MDEKTKKWIFRLYWLGAVLICLAIAASSVIGAVVTFGCFVLLFALILALAQIDWSDF